MDRLSFFLVYRKLLNLGDFLVDSLVGCLLQCEAIMDVFKPKTTPGLFSIENDTDVAGQSSAGRYI